MKKILFFLIALCIGSAAYSQNIYQPNGTMSFTGANSYCVGAPITTPLTYTYTTCNGGAGAPTGASCVIRWYYNLTNSTAITGSTVLASTSLPFAAATSGTGVRTYTPSLSVGGNYYFFCVIDWTGGSSACGLTTGSIVSPFTQLVSIGPAPIAPATPINICNGTNIVLSNTFTGGKWTSSNASVATIDSTTGFASGISVGGTFITYRIGGCFTTAFMYVNANPAAITPVSIPNICVGSALTLTNTTPGGTWSSTVPSVATIGSASGVFSAFSAGTTTVSYVLSATGCFVTRTMTVLANPAPIAGSHNVCVAGNTTLSNTTTGGNWYSSAASIASVGSSTGTVNGLIAGTSTISYIMPATSCFATYTMTVNTAPSVISGPNQVCATSNITLANTVSGGVWTSSNTSIAIVGTSGVITGVSAGTVTISYTTAGCTPATKVITVNSLPASITGITFTCYGQTTTLTTPVFGGRWKTTDTTIARVDSVTGVVSGISMGVSTITYTGAAGCFTTRNVTVFPLAPIVGRDTVCVGSSTALTNIVGGGTWVSSNPDNATIDTFSGIVRGMVNGVTLMEYRLPTGCVTKKLVKVLPALPAIGGPFVVCSNSLLVLSDAIPGGTWSTSNPYVADVATTTGVVSGHTADTATITYSVFGCATSETVTVNPLPTPTLSFNWVTGKLSTPAMYVSYQWYDSTSGPIPGATNNIITLPAVKEKYYVMVSDLNGCAAPSEWFKLPLGVNTPAAVSVHVYPNPATTVLYVDAPTNTSATITGMEGKVIMDATDVRQINVSKLPAGMYLISLYNTEGQAISVQRFVKE